MEKPGVVPFELHGQVNPDASPFLVTKSRGGMLWVEDAPGGAIRAGVCSSTPGEVFLQVVDAVAERSQRLEWGSVHDFSLKGVKSAAEYLNYFGITDMEVLVPQIALPEGVNPGRNKDLEDSIEKILGRRQEPEVFERPDWLDPKNVGLPICPTSWLPKNCAVVIPADRYQVGELIHVSGKYLAAIVRNPSRSIAIARGTPK